MRLNDKATVATYTIVVKTFQLKIKRNLYFKVGNNAELIMTFTDNYNIERNSETARILRLKRAQVEQQGQIWYFTWKIFQICDVIH